MQVLVAVAALQRFHVLHPEVVVERAEHLCSLLEPEFDLEPQTIQADDLDGLELEIRRHQDQSSAGRVLDQHKAHEPSGRSPQQIAAAHAYQDALFIVHWAWDRSERRGAAEQIP